MFARVFKAFTYRDFRLLWFGACFSSIGTWMQTVAQSWLVYDISNSAVMLGWDAFLGQIPIFMFSLLGGVVADRFDRRRVLLIGQLVQMTCALVLAYLLFTHQVHVYQILCLSFIVGTAQAFGGPAYQALIPTLVKSEDMPNAIALNSIQFNLARIIGPVLGGITLSKYGPEWCFSLNALSYIGPVLSLLMVNPGFIPTKAKESVVESMRQGLQFIWNRQAMVPLICLAFMMTFLGIPTMTFLPVMTKEVFGANAETFTRLLSISGAGAVTGALMVAAFGQKKRKGMLALIMLVVLGILTIAFSQSRILWVSQVLLFVAGAALISVFAFVTSLVQLIAKDEMRGRVMSVYNVAFRGGMPFGALISAYFIPTLGVSTVLAINGGLLACLGLYFLIGQREVSRLE